MDIDGKLDNERIKWIDSCKGFATTLVVLGHVLCGYLDAGLFDDQKRIMETISNWIYSFHMALFFSISGYVFYIAYGDDSVYKKSKYNEKIKNFVIVYLSFSIVLWCFKMIFSSAVNSPLKLLDLILIPIAPISPYWYMWNLIIYYLLFAWMIHNRVSDKKMLFFYITCSVVASFTPHITSNIRNLFYYLVTFYFGVVLAKTKCRLLSNPWIVSGSMISFIIAIYFTFIRNVKLSSIKGGNLFFALSSTIVIFYIFTKMMYSWNSRLLGAIGRYSIEIYLLHCFITAANRTLFSVVGINNFYFSALLNLTAGIALPILCSLALTKINLHQFVFNPATALKNLKELK